MTEEQKKWPCFELCLCYVVTAARGDEWGHGRGTCQVMRRSLKTGFHRHCAVFYNPQTRRVTCMTAASFRRSLTSPGPPSLTHHRATSGHRRPGQACLRAKAQGALSPPPCPGRLSSDRYQGHFVPSRGRQALSGRGGRPCSRGGSGEACGLRGLITLFSSRPTSSAKRLIWASRPSSLGSAGTRRKEQRC